MDAISPAASLAERAPRALAVIVETLRSDANVSVYLLAREARIPRTTLERKLGSGEFTTGELYRVAAVVGFSVVEVHRQVVSDPGSQE